MTTNPISATTVAYSQYNCDADEKSLIGGLQKTFANKSGATIAILSVTALVQTFLQEAHNTFSESNVFVKGLAAFGIELGFIANICIIGPAEIAVRLVALPLLLLAGLGACCCCGERDNPGSMLIVLGLLSPAVAALQMGQSAVSAFYSHPAFINQPIDNHGQALCHIFCTAPTVTPPVTIEDTVI